MRLLDADVLVDIQRNHLPAVAWYQSLTELPHVPGLVIMELVQHAQNQRQVRAALRLVRPLPIVWPSEADCDRALADYIAFHLSHIWGCWTP
jgi:predicted nucleic acid-binding protein